MLIVRYQTIENCRKYEYVHNPRSPKAISPRCRCLYIAEANRCPNAKRETFAERVFVTKRRRLFFLSERRVLVRTHSRSLLENCRPMSVFLLCTQHAEIYTIPFYTPPLKSRTFDALRAYNEVFRMFFFVCIFGRPLLARLGSGGAHCDRTYK